MNPQENKKIIGKNGLRIPVLCAILPMAKINHALLIPGTVPRRRSLRKRTDAEEKPKGEKS